MIKPNAIQEEKVEQICKILGVKNLDTAELEEINKSVKANGSCLLIDPKDEQKGLVEWLRIQDGKICTFFHGIQDEYYDIKITPKKFVERLKHNFEDSEESIASQSKCIRKLAKLLSKLADEIESEYEDTPAKED